MSIETKSSIVGVLTVLSVVALIFLTGCDMDRGPVTVLIESTTGRCIVQTNTHLGGEFYTPCKLTINTRGQKCIIVNGWMNGYTYVTVKQDGDVLGRYEGANIYFEIFVE